MKAAGRLKILKNALPEPPQLRKGNSKTKLDQKLLEKVEALYHLHHLHHLHITSITSIAYRPLDRP